MRFDNDCTDCGYPPRQACGWPYYMSSTRLSNGCTRIICTSGPLNTNKHNPSACREYNGKGLVFDSDCIDCGYPPKQACASAYYMSSTRQLNGCTRITCTSRPFNTNMWHNPSACLEYNGKGLLSDNDCIDCGYPPKQACNYPYYMKSTRLSNGCTRITCNYRCSSCSSGKYIYTACSTNKDTVCRSCSKCSSSYYISRRCTSNGNTICSRCSSCSSGYYMKTRCSTYHNTVCSRCSSCSTGYYISSRCSSTRNTVCSHCQGCAAGYYISTPCSTNQNTVCSRCSSCSSGSYMKTQCSTNHNTVCSQCSSCSTGYYISSQCSSTRNTVCSRCQSCAAGYYINTPCSANQNTVCSRCQSCPIGWHISTRCGPDRNTVCSTEAPTGTPTAVPTKPPTSNPTTIPTERPTRQPTRSPTTNPTVSPTSEPTPKPTRPPTLDPTTIPTERPTHRPTSMPTNTPTETPTSAPTPILTRPPTPNDFYYIVRGSKDRACVKQLKRKCSTRAVNKGQLWKVVCCDDVRHPGWRKNRGCSVYTMSKVSQCVEASWNDAVDMCSAVGGRLCTKDELTNNCAKNSRCPYKGKMVWSSTSKENKDYFKGQSYYIVQGKSDAPCRDKLDKKCTTRAVYKDQLWSVVCCADARIVGWKKSGCSVYTHPKDPICGKLSWHDAVDACRDIGGRLCTVEELTNNCVKNHKCGYNSQMVWSSMLA